MMFKSLTILFLCFVWFFTLNALAITNDCQSTSNKLIVIKEQIGTGGIPFPRINAKSVFRVFLEAVDNGQLILFDMHIDRSMINPEHVEYIYTLENHVPTVKVYSTLTTSIPLPIMPDMQIVGVSAVLDREGRIIEAIVHCGN